MHSYTRASTQRANEELLHHRVCAAPSPQLRFLQPCVTGVVTATWLNLLCFPAPSQQPALSREGLLPVAAFAAVPSSSSELSELLTGSGTRIFFSRTAPAPSAAFRFLVFGGALKDSICKKQREASIQEAALALGATHPALHLYGWRAQLWRATASTFLLLARSIKVTQRASARTLLPPHLGAVLSRSE